MLEVSTTNCYACFQLLCEAFNRLVDQLLWQTVPNRLQQFFQFGD